MEDNFEIKIKFGECRLHNLPGIIIKKAMSKPNIHCEELLSL